MFYIKSILVSVLLAVAHANVFNEIMKESQKSFPHSHGDVSVFIDTLKENGATVETMTESQSLRRIASSEPYGASNAVSGYAAIDVYYPNCDYNVKPLSEGYALGTCLTSVKSGANAILSCSSADGFTTLTAQYYNDNQCTSANKTESMTLTTKCGTNNRAALVCHNGNSDPWNDQSGNYVKLGYQTDNCGAAPISYTTAYSVCQDFGIKSLLLTCKNDAVTYNLYDDDTCSDVVTTNYHYFNHKYCIVNPANADDVITDDFPFVETASYRELCSSKDSSDSKSSISKLGGGSEAGGIAVLIIIILAGVAILGLIVYTVAFKKSTSSTSEPLVGRH